MTLIIILIALFNLYLLALFFLLFSPECKLHEAGPAPDVVTIVSLVLETLLNKCQYNECSYNFNNPST